MKGSASQKQMKPKPKERGFKIDWVVASASVSSTTDLNQEMVRRMSEFKASMVWLRVSPFTGLLNMRITFQHLIHIFTGCAFQHIHRWPSCKIVLELSLKNTWAAVLVLGE
ncbi:hypothetical protein HN51_026158 [Arachis hypogaea]